MKVTLMDCTHNPEYKIAVYAAICYDADTSEEAIKRRITKLMNLGHLATLRFAYATFLVDDISRVTSHQLVRHPHLSYLQESQRYVKQNEWDMIIPKGCHTQSVLEAVEACNHAYQELLNSGIPKGDARYILPQGCNTKMYISGNFQAWYDFLKNRTDKAAQWEVREVAKEIHRQLSNIAPSIFRTIND